MNKFLIHPCLNCQMHREVLIESGHKDSMLDIVHDTLKKGKQALVFVNSKKSAERTAEDIARSLKTEKDNRTLSEQALKVLGKPTKQCERLALCLRKNIAFHHAGLHSKQKEIIEENFKAGNVKIICCTPTLAAGVDLPAFRAIIRDVRRYSEFAGMEFIPVLEFMQMSGRAGRPKFDSYGEAIAIASTEAEHDKIIDTFIYGSPEEIVSKLAVEPVLRTYLLSLIATDIITSEKQIMDFFSRTFWAHQYQDLKKLETEIQRILNMLESWQFIEYKNKKYSATLIGRRVSELYLDPLTAHEFIIALEKSKNHAVKDFSFIQLTSATLEMRPYIKVKTKEYIDMQELAAKHSSYLLVKEPSEFDPDYEDWLNAFKTSLLLKDWIEEKDDEYLLETYDARPGETRAKLETADWLLYAVYELAKLVNAKEVLKEIAKVRTRLKYGVKEELLPLIRLKGIGRVRARKLFNNNIKDLGGVKKADIKELGRIVGFEMAISIKKQVGEEVKQLKLIPEVKESAQGFEKWEKPS